MLNGGHGRGAEQGLDGGGCELFGFGAGVETIGRAVRYPDALVTCSRQAGTALKSSDAVVVFEVLRPSSGHVDRIVKVREYAGVPSIRRYVILQSTSIGLQVFERAHDQESWTATTLTAGETLAMPEIAIEIPVDEFYEDVAFGDAAAG